MQLALLSAARAAIAASALVFAAAAAAATLPYTKAAFDGAIATGKPAIVHFHAEWCPTCRAQKPIAAALLAEPKRRNVTLFIADYDSEAALRKQLGVKHQSTFVVFKGGKEVGRSTAQTNREQIAGLFDKALP